MVPKYWMREWMNLRINAKYIFPYFLFLFIALIIEETSILYKPALSNGVEANMEGNMWHAQFSQNENFCKMFYPESLIFSKSCSLYDKQFWGN